MSLAEGLAFVLDQVDDTVAHHDVHAAVLEGDRLGVTLAEFDIRIAVLFGCRPGARQHLIQHVQADDFPGRTDLPGSRKYICTSAAANVQHDLARPQVCQGNRIATAQRKLGFALLHFC